MANIASMDMIIQGQIKQLDITMGISITVDMDIVIQIAQYYFLLSFW